jgi:hypothetical protein
MITFGNRSREAYIVKASKLPEFTLCLIVSGVLFDFPNSPCSGSQSAGLYHVPAKRLSLFLIAAFCRVASNPTPT